MFFNSNNSGVNLVLAWFLLQSPVVGYIVCVCIHSTADRLFFKMDKTAADR